METVNVGDRVAAGEGEDRDTGKVVALAGSKAVVAWDSGVTTTVPTADLDLTDERHSGGHRLA